MHHFIFLTRVHQISNWLDCHNKELNWVHRNNELGRFLYKLQNPWPKVMLKPHVLAVWILEVTTNFKLFIFVLLIIFLITEWLNSCTFTKMWTFLVPVSQVQMLWWDGMDHKIVHVLRKWYEIYRCIMYFNICWFHPLFTTT